MPELEKLQSGGYGFMHGAIIKHRGSISNRSTVAHWYVICFSPGGPGFKSRQGTIFQNKNEKRNL